MLQSNAVHSALLDVRTMLREQVDYRELLLQMTRRDLLLRYKQTVMGFGWAVFMPLVNTVIFSMVFTRVAPIDTGMPYPLYAYSGLLAWTFISSSLRFAVVSLTSNANLVSKVYFPREIFPFSAVLVSLVDTAVATAVLAGMMAWYGVGLHWTALLLPLIVAVHVALTAGVALFLAMGHLFYRDVKYLFEVIINVAMFTTSVVYPIDRVGGTLGAVLALNPVTPVIEGYRSVLLRGALPDWGPLAASAALSIFLLATGWILFHRSERAFAENV